MCACVCVYLCPSNYPSVYSTTVILTAAIYVNAANKFKVAVYGMKVKMKNSSETLDCSYITG